jgi:hypothetical protein
VALWTNRYSGPAGSSDHANALAVDNQGHVFVTGHSSTSEGNLAYATIAYSQAGASLWTNYFNGGGGANAIAVDQNGNVFVTGSSMATIAYSGAGVALWTNRYDGTASAVMVDHSGNVFVTGYSYGPGSNYDYATVAYSGRVCHSGRTATMVRPTGRTDRGLSTSLWPSKCLAIGPNDEVYVTGRSDGHYGEHDDFMTTRRSNMSGDLVSGSNR